MSASWGEAHGYSHWHSWMNCCFKARPLPKTATPTCQLFFQRHGNTRAVQQAKGELGCQHPPCCLTFTLTMGSGTGGEEQMWVSPAHHILWHAGTLKFGNSKPPDWLPFAGCFLPLWQHCCAKAPTKPLQCSKSHPQSLPLEHQQIFCQDTTPCPRSTALSLGVLTHPALHTGIPADSANVTVHSWDSGQSHGCLFTNPRPAHCC